MAPASKSTARRNAIRDHRPDSSAAMWNQAKCSGVFGSIGIAAAFWIVASVILMARQDVLPYRLGQQVKSDIVSRVDFQFVDAGGLKARKQQEARDNCPRVYRSTTDKAGDAWEPVEQMLVALPDRVAQVTFDQLPPDLKPVLDAGSLTALQRQNGRLAHAEWEKSVRAAVDTFRQSGWVLLSAADRNVDINTRRTLKLVPEDRLIRPSATHALPADADLESLVRRVVELNFRTELQPKLRQLVIAAVRPTHVLDADLTADEANRAVASLPVSDYTIQYRANEPIVLKDHAITDRDWQILRAENQKFRAEGQWQEKLGLAGVALLLTMATAAYTAHFQPKIVRNHARGIAIAALLLSMLLLAELAGIGTGPLYLVGIVPSLLVGVVLSLAYDQRFAVSLGSVHAMMVTIGLDQRAGFLLIIWVGIVSMILLLRDVRTRSRLIEVGGVAAVVMMVATAAVGLIAGDTGRFLLVNCLYAGAAGLVVGFVVLGILPFVEKSFRITTSMTLLELADANHPLLRRLALEAPGTCSHSWQVATLAQAAAEAIGANSLLCRVAAYYHDVGKINKAEYFVENQHAGQQSRHMTLNPSVSFLIIKGHVADGIELAKEYNLPTSLFPFIMQHHGTTLVEYFYHAAKKQAEGRGDDTEVNEVDFRYPGPKPKSREVAILMLADAAESATRAMVEPTAGRIEQLVHDLAMRRMADGQLDDCDLTLRDLAGIEKSLVRTLLSIYHGRIPYPTTIGLTKGTTDAVASPA